MIPVENIPQDPALPQLAAVLDAEGMAREFECHMFGPSTSNDRLNGDTASERFQVRDCYIERIKYRPGEKCTIAYRLDVQDRRTGKQHQHLLSGRIRGIGGSDAHYTKAQSQSLVMPKFGPPLFHIQSLEMVVWSFPNDLKLHELPVLIDSARLKSQLLPPIVRSRWGAAWQIAELTQRVENYVPAGRCCVRVDMRLEHMETGETLPWRVFGKTYYDDKGEHADRVLQQLWASEARTRGDIGVPRPLGYQPEYRLFWQEGLAGQTLPERIGNGGDEAALLCKAGEALAALHRTPIPCERESRVQDVVNVLRSLEPILGEARPSSRTHMSITVRRLLDQAPGLPDPQLATIHGDLHPKNIFVDGERVSFIDLDEVSRGPAARNLGSFIARVLYDATLREKPLASVRPAIRKFVLRYRTCTGWPVSQFEIAWYTAAALINERALRCMTRLKSGRLEMFDDLIELADRISEGDETLGIADANG